MMDELKEDALKEWFNLITDEETVYDLCSTLLGQQVLLPLQSEEVEHLVEHDSVKSALSYMHNAVVMREINPLESVCTALQQLNASSLLRELKKIVQNKLPPDHFTEVASLFNENFPTKTFDECYIVNSDPRGLVLILNNTFNDIPAMKRRGSEWDANNLERLFKDLNYSVTVSHDLSESDMLTAIDEFVRNPEHQYNSAGGLIIMSHGNDIGILDSSGKKSIPVAKLISPIRRPYSQLLGKPVFVILQACRGNETIFSIANLHSQVQLLSDGRLVVDPQEEETAGQSAQCSGENATVHLDDMVILYSSLPSFITHRDITHGALFVQALCDVLRKEGKNLPWQDLCSLIADKDAEYQLRYRLFSAIVPEFDIRLSKLFYLDTKMDFS